MSVRKRTDGECVCVSEVLCEPPSKKPLLKKSNKTAPAPLGSLLTDVVIDRRRLPPLASPPPIQMVFPIIYLQS